MSTTTLQIEKKKMLVPQLRFPEFDGEWERCKIGDNLTIGSGRDYKHLEIGNIPVFGTGGLMTYVNKFLYDGETVCIGRKGTIDKPMFYSGKIWTVDTLFYTHSFNSSLPKFIFNVFQRINWKEHNEASGVPSLSKSTIEKINISIPTLPEQKKIASFLSAVDEKIQQLSRKKELLAQYKKGVMQQLFSGKLRFKDENGQDYPEWEEKKLKDLVDKERKIRYGIVQPGDYDPSGRFMIRGQDYSSVKGWADSSEFFKVSEVIEQKYIKARVKAGDLLITIVGAGTGWLEVVPNFLEGANITQTTGRIAIDKSIASPGYVKNYFFTHTGRKEINGYIKGQAQPGLNIGDVENFKLPLPCIAEQQKIANFLSGIDGKIEQVNGELVKTQEFKKGLLQQMFV
ncbi:restriction endonuclease subunit S [Flavobacterium sp. GNP001]